MSMMRLVTFNDEPLLSAALTSILRDAGDIDLLALVARVDGVVPAVLDRQPDILLLSLTSEVHAGMIRQLRQASPNCRIVLWVHSIASELAHQAMEIGVRGILRRTCPADMVLKCLRKVHEGELWFDQSLTSSFLACRKVRLTRREAQLVHLLAEGLKNKEIATALSLSEGTVKVYLSRLFEKVGAKDRFELALFSLRNLLKTEPAPRSNGIVNDDLRVLYLDAPGGPPMAPRPPLSVLPFRRSVVGAGRFR